MDLEHPCLCVSDLDRAAEFYEALGFEHTHSFTLNGEENYYVGHPDGRGEIQLRYDPDRTTPIAPNRADVNHIAFSVDEIEEITEDLQEKEDVDQVTDPYYVEHTGRTITNFRDPDGRRFQIVQDDE